MYKANDETRGETHRTTKMDGNVDEIVVEQKNTERERRVNDTDDRIRSRDGAARSRTSSRDCYVFQKSKRQPRRGGGGGAKDHQKRLRALGDDEGRRG